MENLLLLRDWLKLNQSLPKPFKQHYYKRIQLALESPQLTGKRDLAALIRSVLRYEQERQPGGKAPFLAVPCGELWPSESLWHDSGMDVLERQPSFLLVRPRTWKPDWLPYSHRYPPEESLFQEKIRRPIEEMPGDPFLTAVGKESYRNEGQYHAIRSIFTAPKTATIVVNLPTGSGKSLCAQLPAILGAKPHGVTVVIVPTVTLAIDQERAMAEYIGHPTAYYSAPGRRAANEEIYRRIMDGTQTIVFASPESVLGSLDKPLQLAAGRGYFRMLVIDEAHIVEAWGLDFRTSFQELAGWRNQMLRHTEFQTILLSATMTVSCLDCLEKLFGMPGPFRVFSAVHLRPEPAYWFRHCISEEEKHERLTEALHHLPRPLILYTSKVEDARDWHHRLRNIGYFRCGLITGETHPDRREEMMEQWRNQQLDIMVATSAFGLGVDNADVRAIIHACVPETLDRYYQEVGRGGRDGTASLSLVVYTDKDIRTAERMNRTLLIRMGRCKERWEQMFRSKVAVEGEMGHFRVPINVPPGTSGRDLDMSNDYNEMWHVRTLTLLNQVGVINLGWPGIDEPVEVKSQWRWVYVPNDDPDYGDKVDAFRKGHFNYLKKQLQQMKDILRGTCCTAKPLKELYAMSQNGKWQVPVMESCGGCPACRAEDKEPTVGVAVSKTITWEESVFAPAESLLKGFLRSDGRMAIGYPQRFKSPVTTWGVRERDGWIRVIRWFIDQGLRQIVAPREWLELFRNQPFLVDRVVFLTDIDRYPWSRMWVQVPTIAIGYERHARILETFPPKEPMVYLLPDATEHPSWPGRRWVDMINCRYYVWEEFRKEVGL